MELKDLLQLQAPTLEQYAEMERQLQSIHREASAEIARLDAETVARGADRLIGMDDGIEARAAARAAAVQRRQDAENVLADVRGKSAALEARLQKEADDRAWAEVRGLIDSRVEALKEIEGLCTRIGELYVDVIKKGKAAMDAAPVKPEPRDYTFNQLAGRHPAQIAYAILAKMNYEVGHPTQSLPYSEDMMVAVERHVHRLGLDGYLQPLHDRMMGAA